MTLRVFRKSALTLATAAIVSQGFAESDEKPNIIFFLVDDMGWQDTSVPFWKQKTPINEKFRTPNMERLTSQGMKFTQAYACPVCSPTRTSLMTGMNAARHRVTNWTLRKNQTADAVDSVLEFPEWNLNGLQPESVDTISQTVSATTLPQILRDNGYFTIHCGKAHWGAETTPGADPLNLGFDVNIGGHCAGGPGSYLGIQNYSAAWRNGDRIWDIPGLEKYHGTDTYLTEALTLEALKSIEQARKNQTPFYLYMSHYAVHVPYAVDNRFYDKYKKAGLNDTEAMYAALIEGMDKSLGDILDYLERHGLNDNTVLLFMSDNGGLSVHGRGGTPNAHNLPLNSGKGSAYEGGIREPMIVKWPGVVHPNSTCGEYVIIEDFFPAILEIAGIKDYKTVQQLDGKSFVPMLMQKGTTARGRDLFWHFPNNWGPKGPGIGATSTIRSGDWKLIYWYSDQHFELFNIRKDIGEKNNLAQSKLKKTRKMAARLGKYLRGVDAQRPILKAIQKPAPWPDESFLYQVNTK